MAEKGGWSFKQTNNILQTLIQYLHVYNCIYIYVHLYIKYYNQYHLVIHDLFRPLKVISFSSKYVDPTEASTFQRLQFDSCPLTLLAVKNSVEVQEMGVKH